MLQPYQLLLIRPKQVINNVIGQLQGPTLNSATPDNSLAAPVAPPQKVNQPKKWALFVPKPVKEDETEVQVKGHTIKDHDAYIINRCQRSIGLLKNNVEPRVANIDVKVRTFK